MRHKDEGRGGNHGIRNPGSDQSGRNMSSTQGSSPGSRMDDKNRRQSDELKSHQQPRDADGQFASKRGGDKGSHR